MPLFYFLRLYRGETEARNLTILQYRTQSGAPCTLRIGVLYNYFWKWFPYFIAEVRILPSVRRTESSLKELKIGWYSVSLGPLDTWVSLCHGVSRGPVCATVAMAGTKLLCVTFLCVSVDKNVNTKVSVSAVWKNSSWMVDPGSSQVVEVCVFVLYVTRAWLLLKCPIYWHPKEMFYIHRPWFSPNFLCYFGLINTNLNTPVGHVCKRWLYPTGIRTRFPDIGSWSKQCETCTYRSH